MILTRRGHRGQNFESAYKAVPHQSQTRVLVAVCESARGQLDRGEIVMSGFGTDIFYVRPVLENKLDLISFNYCK